MRHDQADRDVRPARSRFGRSRGRGARSEISEHDDGVYLAAADVWMPLVGARDLPLLSTLAGEDLCWQAGMADWRARRPAVWHRGEWQAWRAEGRTLASKRSRIRSAARDLGLT